nr:hypothetical protein [Tanacetum cinerariifolium]
MTSFGYRLNPRYAIKECLSCGALYTENFCCSKGSVEDKDHGVKSSQNPSPIDECCCECGNALDGIFCQQCICKSCGKGAHIGYNCSPKVPIISNPEPCNQTMNDELPKTFPGCSLLREKLEEDLITYLKYFQDTSESSDDSTNVVNAPREPIVVKQDHGVNPPHIDKCCCECGNALDGIFCQQCICKSCGKGAHTGYNCPPKVPIISNLEPCNQTINNEPPQTLPSFDPPCYFEKEKPVPCVSKPNFVDESSKIFNPPPQPPIYSCEFCESNAQYGHYCTPQAPFNNPEPGYSQDLNFPQDIHNFQQQKFNRYSFFETPKVVLLAWDRVSKIKDAFESKQNKPEDIHELFRKLLDDLQNIHEELAEFIKSLSWNRIPDTMCDVHLVKNPTPLEAKDHFEIVINSNDDISSSDDDSLYYENIEYVEASPHDYEFVSLEVEKIVLPEDEEIEDDNLCEKLLKVNLLIAEIEALKDNPTPSSEFLTKSSSTSLNLSWRRLTLFIILCLNLKTSALIWKRLVVAVPLLILIYLFRTLKDNPTQSSDCKTKSSSTSLNSFLEETNTFHNSLPEFKNFYFVLGEISSGSTTTHCDISLPDYEAFYFDDDHIKEISSGSTTTHSDISLSEYDSFIFDFTHEEFVDELAHIISFPEYDRFYFWNLPDQGELMSVLNSGIRKNLSTTLVNLPIEDEYSPLLAYVVWIFVFYLTYPVIPPYLHPFGNEDTIFDPRIT